MSTVVYNIGLEGSGEFPRTVEEELKNLPPDTKLLEISDSQQITEFMSHENNTVIDGQLVFGTPVAIPLPSPIPRNALTELDALKQKLIDKGILSALEIL